MRSLWGLSWLPEISFSTEPFPPFVDELQAELEIKDETIKRLKERFEKLQTAYGLKAVEANESKEKIAFLKSQLEKLATSLL